jgi:hypothetical protein
VGGAFAVRSRVQQAAGSGSRHSHSARRVHSHSPWDSLADDRHGAALPLPLHVLSIHGCRARAHLERGRATSRVAHRHPAALALPLPVRLLLVSRHLAVTVP